MFVIKNMSTNKYVRRHPGSALQKMNSFNHVDDINDATVFSGIELMNWMYERGRDYTIFSPMINIDWKLVEVRKVDHPQYEEVKVIG